MKLHKRLGFWIILFVFLLLIILFAIYKPYSEDNIIDINETKECYLGLERCDGKNYFLCSNFTWNLQGEIPNKCGVEPIPFKDTYYRFNNMTNDCSTINIYPQEKTANDYLNLTKCSANIYIPPENKMCIDSDDMDFINKGNLNLNGQTFYDYCSTGINLQEYYCSSNESYQTYSQPCNSFGINYTCQDGRCRGCKQSGEQIGSIITSFSITRVPLGGIINVSYVTLDNLIMPRFEYMDLSYSVSTVLYEYNCTNRGRSNADYALRIRWINQEMYLQLLDLFSKFPPCFCKFND